MPNKLKVDAVLMSIVLLVAGQLAGTAIGLAGASNYVQRDRAARSYISFWHWFQQHEKSLFAVRTAREPICTELKAELTKIHPDLTFEFGPVEKGRREFIISAGGIREAFTAVIQLAKAAPPLARWKIVQFRPRTTPMKIEMNGLTVDPKQVEVLIRHEGGKFALTMSIPGYRITPDQKYEQIGYLLLDHSIGEYTLETRIAAIDFVAPANRPKGHWHPLRDLPKVIDASPVTSVFRHDSQRAASTRRGFLVVLGMTIRPFSCPFVRLRGFKEFLCATSAPLRLCGDDSRRSSVSPNRRILPGTQG